MTCHSMLRSALIAVLGLSGTAQSAAVIYLNENIGFNIPGYHYQQGQFPCEVDTVLVKALLERGQRQGITLQPVNSAGQIHNASGPLLAIDVNQLVMGREGHNYGADTDSPLPSAQVTVALVDKRFDKGHISAPHQCAITSLQRFTPSSNILDLGSGGVTVCDAMRTCLKDMSVDIIDWVEKNRPTR